jgi:hypothetical protein
MHLPNAPSQPLTIPRLPRPLKDGSRAVFDHAQQAAGSFPPSIALGSRAVGWLYREVDAVIRARSIGCEDRAIASIVARLVAAR